MESILVGIVIIGLIVFCLSVIIGMLSIKFDWDIEDWCMGIGIASLTICFTVASIGALLYGGKVK